MKRIQNTTRRRVPNQTGPNKQKRKHNGTHTKIVRLVLASHCCVYAQRVESIACERRLLLCRLICAVGANFIRSTSERCSETVVEPILGKANVERESEPNARKNSILPHTNTQQATAFATHTQAALRALNKFDSATSCQRTKIIEKKNSI